MAVADHKKPAGSPPKRLSAEQFRPMLKRLTERLYDSVNRGPMLKCFATKGFRTRMDVLRLNAAVQDGSGHDCASSLVETLVRNESASVSLELDIAAEDPRRRESSLALYYALTQGIIRGADAIYRESGLRSLWLAYPFLLARDISDPENRRHIVAPIYLWPVQIHASLKRQGELIVCRDPRAGSPVFNRVLARWARVNLNVDIPAEELQSNEEGRIELSEISAVLHSMLKGFQSIQIPDLTAGLTPLPSRKEAANLQQPAVLNTAALGLFVSENQALIENLEKLQLFEGLNDPLDSILANRQADPDPVTLPREKDRYLVTDSDPYQELAIWEARKLPGSIVHGPPGTGKSQTIVNIVADCLARGERVLVVCQKRAAIDVVSERLRAAGLDELCLVVHDSESDRRQIFSALKEQIAALREHATGASASERERLAQEIDRREDELDLYHNALQRPRAAIGFSYRQLVGKATSIFNNCPGLRSDPSIENLLSARSSDDLNCAEEQLKELAHLWEEALPTINPWIHRSHDFALTRPVREEIAGHIESCRKAANAVELFVASYSLGLRFDGKASEFISAANEWRQWIAELLGSDRLKLCTYWLQRRSANLTSELESATRNLDEALRLAERSALISRDQNFAKVLDRITDAELDRAIQAVATLGKRYSRGWWTVLTRSHRAAGRLWDNAGLDPALRSTREGLHTAQQQCERTRDIRHSRTLLAQLGLVPADASPEAPPIAVIRKNIQGCRDADKLLRGSNGNNSLAALRAAVETQKIESIREWIRSIETAIGRAELLVTLGQLLGRLDRWLKADYLSEILAKAQNGEKVDADFELLLAYLDRLPQLCAFDAARAGSSEPVTSLLSVLEKTPITPRAAVWERWVAILRYSAYSIWINNCLKETPVLQALTPELHERTRRALAESISKKRGIEVQAILDRWLNAQSQLHSLRPSPLIALSKQLVTRGPNSKRLRQAAAAGSENGIFALRPCWMMNPNTACQVFQFVPGTFDVIIFDEASQCPLEQAVPVLHRAKRVVVAGDEKQLPPTAFFMNLTPADDDDAEENEESNEDQLQRDLIKDVLATTDLLTVCESVLRNSYLDMHYRSEHPLLIQFSNKAFYGGRLQCPPSVESQTADVPIEVRTTNGVYEKQTNETEARAVVKLLRELWLEKGIAATIGVVTFNLKQEDLIQNCLQTEALRDEEFRMKYESECERKDGRQDVSFFVKNLESVQGDERDVMIFSTTFGLDAAGQFKRFFGPLNKEGGERRLNVAVTRAKKKIFIITSLPVSQISDAFSSAGTKSGGTRTGRDYLQAYMRYAEAVSNGDHQTRQIVEEQLGELSNIVGSPNVIAEATHDFDSEFEIAVFDALTKHGLSVDQQVGDSGFRIDLAIRHPLSADRYILGIECDGRSYHSKFTARARDIWRQQILQARGWKIHRVWSTNWSMDPDAEVAKILARVKALERTPEPTS